MADDLARRREIRRRKILESSEARLKKITSNSSKKLQDEAFCEGYKGEADEIAKDPEMEEYDDHAHSKLCGIKVTQDYSESSCPHQAGMEEDPITRNRLTGNDTLRSHPTNGDYSRSPDSYTFPKKVSDAETRSFGRTRTDARRNSTCTQIMMETLQFSSFSLTVLRFWLVAMAAFVVKMSFLMFDVLPIFNTIFFPFLMLEVTFFSWSKLETQVCSRPVASPIISSVLLLCGLSSNVISGFNSVSNFIHFSVQDFCVYMFSFVFLHFIFEMSV